MKSTNDSAIWDRGILEAKNYHEFTNWHLKELVRMRFLKNDWPKGFKDFMLKATAQDFFAFAKVTPSKNKQFKNETWTGFDMIFDFYRLHSADELAFKDIGENRMHQYKIIMDSYLNYYGKIINPTIIETSFYEFCSIFKSFQKGAPSNNFIINLRRNTIHN